MLSLGESQYANLLNEILTGGIDVHDLVVANTTLCVRKGDTLDRYHRVDCASREGAETLRAYLRGAARAHGRCDDC